MKVKISQFVFVKWAFLSLVPVSSLVLWREWPVIEECFLFLSWTRMAWLEWTRWLEWPPGILKPELKALFLVAGMASWSAGCFFGVLVAALSSGGTEGMLTVYSHWWEGLPGRAGKSFLKYFSKYYYVCQHACLFNMYGICGSQKSMLYPPVLHFQVVLHQHMCVLS